MNVAFAEESSSERLFRALPIARDDRRDRIALLGVSNRGCERLRERDGAVLLQQLIPSRERAGHRHRLDSARRHLLPSATEQRFARHERAGASARIDRDEPMLLRDPHRREHVAADTRHHRLGHGEHGRSGDGRVDGVAARIAARPAPPSSRAVDSWRRCRAARTRPSVRRQRADAAPRQEWEHPERTSRRVIVERVAFASMGSPSDWS